MSLFRSNARQLRDVFEAEGVPGLRGFYDEGIYPWKAIYRGKYAPWHRVDAPTARDPNGKRALFRLNMAKAVCAELAGLVWGEQARLRVSAAGGGEADLLDEYVQEVLAGNGFFAGAQAMIEKGLALGGAAVKIWGEGGGADARIRVGFCAADQFVPLSWDGDGVTEAVFISRLSRRGANYTRLEWHRRAGDGWAIDNELYRADALPGGARDILGARCPLEEACPELDGHALVRTDAPLFAYWRTPVANNLADDCPLGVSVFANSLETLHGIDLCYDSLIQEFRLGRKRIVVPARFLRTVVDPQTGQARRYYDPGDEAFVGLADDEGGGVQDLTSPLRVEEHVAALNALLGLLCMQLGFSAGAFSFSEHGGLRTATEVVSENSKTYKTVRTLQNQLVPALERVARGVVDAACLYGVRYKGVPVEKLAAGGCEVKVAFDDGVTQDRQAGVDEGLALVAAGLLSRYTFLTDRRYGQGLTDREARAELERIGGERGTGIRN